MKATLIHNPDAGDDKQPTAGQIEVLMNEAGYKVRYQSSKEKGWQRVLKKSADIIVVAAGDGTVGKVARRMIGKDAPIAVLPMGTANNISRTLGIADMPVTQLIRAWKTSRHLRFDAGIAIGPWGERYFIEGIGAGLLTSSIPKVEFQVILLAEKHRRKLHDHIKNWQEGKLRPPEFEARRGKQLQIEWTGFPIHIDDKIWPEKGKRKPKPPATISVHVEPHAVEFLVPKEVDDFEVPSVFRLPRVRFQAANFRSC